MHIHTMAASASGNALAGAQATETAMALRRARELREAGQKLKAESILVSGDLPQDPDTVAMVTAWSGGNAASGQRPQPETSTNSQPQNTLPQIQQIQEVQRSPAAAPVSYWA